jgi:hypothetical protein
MYSRAFMPPLAGLGSIGQLLPTAFAMGQTMSALAGLTRIRHRIYEQEYLVKLHCLRLQLQDPRPHPYADAFREAFLALPRVGDPLGIPTFLHAADIYHPGRSKGLTIRSSVDSLIAAIAIEDRIPVWHKDRDFATIARFTSLEAVTRLQAGPQL